jgi:uncharacterized membrane protein
MHMSHFHFHYLPLAPGFFSILVGFFVVMIIALAVFGALRHAYVSLGVSPRTAMLLLFGTLIGSYFNIPIAVLAPEPLQSDKVIDFSGVQYTVPVVEHLAGTVIAVNVGGAVIPTIMSIYLLVTRQLWWKVATATAIVALILHWLANPVPGIGIAVPVFFPAIVTAVVALLLSRRNARLHCRQPGHADRRRSHQSRQGRRSWCAGRLHRRRGDVRRHFSHRHSRRAAGGDLPSPAERRDGLAYRRFQQRGDKANVPPSCHCHQMP